MGVFWILTPAVFADGKNLGFVFENGATTVEELSDKLADNGIVSGSKLILTDDGRGGKLCKNRQPMAFTLKNVLSIQPYSFRVWEPEDAVQ